jgi:hypothetical protein
VKVTSLFIRIPNNCTVILCKPLHKKNAMPKLPVEKNAHLTSPWGGTGKRGFNEFEVWSV